jgi:hypothetical protein
VDALRDFGKALHSAPGRAGGRGQDLMPAARGVLAHAGSELVLTLLKAGRIL